MSSLELFQPWPADLVKDMVMYSICHVPLSKGFGYPNTLNFSMQEGCQLNEDANPKLMNLPTLAINAGFGKVAASMEWSTDSIQIGNSQIFQ